MAIIVNDFDPKLFNLNGIKYARNFQAIRSGNKVRISNAYDSRFSLAIGHYSEYVVNGLSFANIDSLISTLSGILFVKDELQANESGEAANTTITAIFSNIYGTWINNPTSPGSGSITLDTTNSVNGGISAIYYKGAVITKNTFIGGTIVFLSGINVLNELCLVYVLFDKSSGGFAVNIQVGATGDIPANNAPAQMTINSVIDQDSIAPAQMTINSVV